MTFLGTQAFHMSVPASATNARSSGPYGMRREPQTLGPAGRSFHTLFLDVGGVLLVPDAQRLSTVLSGFGLDVTPYDVQRALFSCSPHDLGFNSLGDGSDVAAYVRALVRVLGGEPDPVPSLLTEVRAALLEADWLPRDAEQDRVLLDGLLQNGVQVVLVTNGEERTQRLLAEAGLVEDRPAAMGGTLAVQVVNSHDLGVAKPDPEIFRRALVLAGLQSPVGVLHVGDSLRNDVQCARQAGLAAAHFNPYASCVNADHPDIRSLSEVPSVMLLSPADEGRA